MASSDHSDEGLVRLRFAPQILARLGEELIPHADLGIVELVRNCYDANAPSCTITLKDVEKAGGSVVIADDGDGMTREELETGFLMIGHSLKPAQPMTLNDRRKIGEKGLGRLAGLRLGHRVEVRTRPLSEPNTEYRLAIDWDAFDRVTTVDAVTMPLAVDTTTEPPGTTIKITYLRRPLAHADVERLVRSLFLINDPFGARAGGFLVRLLAPGFEELAERLANGYFDQIEYMIDAHLDGDGKASVRVLDWRGVETSSFEHADIAADRKGAPFRAPSCTFKLWVIPLGGESYRQRGSTVPLSELRQWLKQVGGVHLYHRGLRVHPYGDPGHDWLDMNLRRTSSPEERPSTNNSVGLFVVEGDGELLTQKTDRSGFIENEPFRELREFGQAALHRVASDRVKRRDADREKRRKETQDAVERTDAELKQELEQLPAENRRRVEKKVTAKQQSLEKRVKVLEQDLALYRTLGTVGTTAAVFAHESLMPVSSLKLQAELIEMAGRIGLPDDYEAHLARPVERIRTAADSLDASAQMTLRLAKRSKRKSGTVSLHASIEELVAIILPRLEGRSISIERRLEAENDAVITTVASIEAILANLLVNASRELSGTDGPPPGERTILVRSKNDGKNVVFEVLDNGPGIRNIPLDDIWLPGQSTYADGTGLGLTIVRDVVADLKGRTAVIAKGEIGGAQFSISLPTANRKDKRATRSASQHGPGSNSDQERLL